MIAKHGFISILLLVLLITLSGCATLSKQDCETIDWSQLGEHDGASGYRASYFDSHQNACAKHNIAVDKQAYLNGRQTGLKKYCTRGNGLTLGSRGEDYRFVCPAELEQEFLQGYRAGKHDYQRKQDRRSR